MHPLTMKAVVKMPRKSGKLAPNSSLCSFRPKFLTRNLEQEHFLMRQTALLRIILDLFELITGQDLYPKK